MLRGTLLRCRRAGVDDYDIYWEIGYRQGHFEHPHRERMRREFEAIFRHGVPLAQVVEEVADTHPVPIGISLATFVTSEFADECLSADAPYVRERLLQWIESEKGPLVRPQALASLNRSGSLDLLILDFGVAPNLGSEDQRFAEDFLMREFLERSRGYSLNRALVEVDSDQGKSLVRNNGFMLVNDYARWRESPASSGHRNPELYGVTRDEALDAGNYILVRLFAHSAPTLGLTRVQQELLSLAIEDLTDAELADALCISKSAVNDRWDSIYPIFEHHFPWMFPQAEPGKRGKEKRRRVIAFAREHPEELRPW